jgi:hypothetical protein
MCAWLIFTSFCVVIYYFRATPLFQISAQERIFGREWHRIVFDECQHLSTQRSGLKKLKRLAESGSHTWLVSGTPLLGEVASLQPLLQVLGVYPFAR